MRVVFIDNGVTGTIGYYDGTRADFKLTPTVSLQDYTKAKKNITRISTPKLSNILYEYLGYSSELIMVVLERPMINPARFTASISAARALEATMTVLEVALLPYTFCDSKEWQRGLLPSSGTKGVDSKTLKQESRDIGERLFPQFKELIHRHKDADGILGAYSRWRTLNYKKEDV